MPLARAASAESAESAVSGPSTTALPNIPRSAIVLSAAASAVDTKAGVTTSVAANSATIGVTSPVARASSIVLATMSFFAARFGTTLSCASATNRPLGRPGMSTKYACESRRSERNPASGAATGASRSPSLMLPLINTDTLPSRATSAARAPDARGSSSASTIDRREMSSPALAAASRIRLSGPTRTGAR